jgi:hypothetical protein
MKVTAPLICLTVILYVGALTPGPAGESWTLAHDIALMSKSPSGGALKDETVTADLYRPNVEGRVPAAVIVNSSGGVSAQTDHFYARLLAEHGVAALVVDSFRPRGVRETMSNQRFVNQSQSAADAVGGFRWLAGQPWADRNRIMAGMSRGGSQRWTRPSTPIELIFAGTRRQVRRPRCNLSCLHDPERECTHHRSPDLFPAFGAR